MRIGILSGAFGTRSVRDLAKAVGRFHLPVLQLNLKNLSDVDPAPGKLSGGLANTIAEEFLRVGVRVPVIGAYTNLIHPDETTRAIGLRKIKEQLRFAPDFGARIVATETGTLNARDQYAGDPRNQDPRWYKLLRTIVRDLVEEAERWGVFLALEGYTENVIDTPERMAQLIGEIDSSHLGIVMDPCNYIDTGNLGRQVDVMDDAFARLGEHTLIAHAKDFVVTDGVMRQPAAGTGGLDYPHFAKRLIAAKPHVDLFLEHLREEEIPSSLAVVAQAFGEPRAADAGSMPGGSESAGARSAASRRRSK